ncbi:M20 family metallopeptidase [Brevifollis gellanilyticus]|uniref:Probable succinyl-diaminopimelate desuccinylase n=1 Tax=Brevifollis gellanilyticus TaxID=748831 RepID=A0A512MEZ8_9BACT|nr:M20 family metallopeptidase [Brevifollis gellanilyticus]GEP45276.1 acetylornithine deacetylase [Brevifollis gellanilyticus]
MSPVIETLADLVRINSVNSSYEGGPGEGEIAAYVKRFFDQRGIETSEQEVFPGRPNVIARLPGRDSSRRIVLEAHTDTVSVKGMTIPPFEPTIRDGKMYGRGSCDTKAGLATMMHALASLKEEGITSQCEVLLAAAVDEEYSYRGVVRLCEGLKADAAIVAEPTELRAVIATKGVLRCRIVVHGRSAHSSKPHLGVNAITHMARVIAAIEADNERMTTITHPLVGHGTCNVGVISGGVQVNFVPDRCAIEIDRRLLPGERASDAVAHYRQLLKSIDGITTDVEEPLLLVDEALDTPAESAVVKTATRVLREMGLNAEPCGVPFGCDASKLSRAGIPSIVFGPGSIDRAHTADEYIELDQVERAYEFQRRFLLSFA